MPITLLDPFAVVLSDAASAPVPVGESARPGDTRIVRVQCSRSTTLNYPAGWTVAYDSIAQSSGGPYSRRVVILTRDLAEGDTDAAVTPSSASVANMAVTAITVRGRDKSQTLSFSTTGSTTSATNVVAPSVSAGIGVLLCWFDVTRVDGTANTGAWGTPSGMTPRASALAPITNGYNVLLCSEVEATANTTGTRTATAGSAGQWSATTVAITEAAATAGPPPGRMHAAYA